jgi:hypothetical protein
LHDNYSVIIGTDGGILQNNSSNILVELKILKRSFIQKNRKKLGFGIKAVRTNICRTPEETAPGERSRHGDSLRVRARFSGLLHTRVWAHPFPCTMGTASLSWG